jgi:hypothetical protein
MSSIILGFPIPPNGATILAMAAQMYAAGVIMNYNFIQVIVQKMPELKMDISSLRHVRRLKVNLLIHLHDWSLNVKATGNMEK